MAKTVASPPKSAAAKKAAPPAAQSETIAPIKTGTNGMKKSYLKSRARCKVTFRLPKEAVTDAQSVCIAGEFNGWNIYATPLKRQKDGGFSITLELDTGREYQFRYLIDDMYWENDWAADKYVRSAFGDCDNSVVVV